MSKQAAAMQPGQRWVSDSEPELGLGIILECTSSKAKISFAAAQQIRIYALDSAPLRRVEFKAGESIRNQQGEWLEVIQSRQEDGILIYHTCQGELCETKLHDAMSFCSPFERLYAEQIDDLYVFRLRTEALFRNYALKRSQVRGFVGMRGDLIPHQISIAAELSKRIYPRALLADEVGLGKTIEACLLMHHLHLTGRADRILILLPEALINQWFIEILRKFNMMFSIFDEERCQSIEKQGETNPFLSSQLVIASQSFFTSNIERTSQAVKAGWDLLIADEVHHIHWTPSESSLQYRILEKFTRSINSVLLLSATPHQLGIESHFAKLRLLDPQRFKNLETFTRQSQNYEFLAQIITEIHGTNKVNSKTREWIKDNIPETTTDFKSLSNQDIETISESILDRFGIGRVMFRNRRENLPNFPNRHVHFHTLKNKHSEEKAKLKWLVNYLHSKPKIKTLLITRTKSSAEHIATQLQYLTTVKIATFHEDLSLNQRDRNAAYFSQAQGAQLLICSEIGSEGRNFQFSNHLILWDLPLHPDLLEQRIGRLDRIGQNKDIQIHIPIIMQSSEAFLADWYHRGLNAFKDTVKGGEQIFKKMKSKLEKVLLTKDSFEHERLIKETVKASHNLNISLAAGYEKLLELNSNRGSLAKKIITGIEKIDDSVDFKPFLIRLWDHFRLDVEQLTDSTYFLKPGHVISDAFPRIPDCGVSVTFERDKAKSREELEFMTMDHPIARASFDLLIGSENGNACFTHWKSNTGKALILEALFLLETVAPSYLNLDRFLPATPIRVVVDHLKNDLSTERALYTLKQSHERSFRKLMQIPKIKQQAIPKLKQYANEIAKEQVSEIINKALSRMMSVLNPEISRLSELSKLNPMVTKEEIDALITVREELKNYIQSSRIRIDSIHLIWKE